MVCSAGSNISFEALRHDFFDIRMWTGDDVDGNHFAHLGSCSCACIGCSFDCADIAADHCGDQAGTDFDLTNQNHIGSFHHGIGCFNVGDQAPSFDHSQRLFCHL